MKNIYFPSNIVIIVNGPPATGKSFISQKISKHLNLPYYSKDTYKEILFDILGCDNREMSKVLGLASFNILYRILEEHLKMKIPLIIETAFYTKIASPKFNQFEHDYNAKFLQIYCSALPEIIQRRFTNRITSGERHHGHKDDVKAMSDPKIFKRYDPLNISGSLINLNTNNLDTLDYISLINQIKDEVNKLSV